MCIFKTQRVRRLCYSTSDSSDFGIFVFKLHITSNLWLSRHFSPLFFFYFSRCSLSRYTFLLVYRAKWTCSISDLPDDAIASLFWGQSLSSRILTWSIRCSRSVVVFGPHTTRRSVRAPILIGDSIRSWFQSMTKGNIEKGRVPLFVGSHGADLSAYASVNFRLDRAWFFDWIVLKRGSAKKKT